MPSKAEVTLTASPNPVPWGEGSGVTTLRWSAPGCDHGASLCSRRDDEPETPIANGAFGEETLDWIMAGSTYRFTLYESAAHATALATGEVTRPLVLWSVLKDGLRQRLERGRNVDEMADLLGDVLPWCVYSEGYHDYFAGWERQGIHVTPVHFYYPIPDTRGLRPSVWRKAYDAPGLDMREEEQLRLLTEVFPAYREEYDGFPRARGRNDHDFYFDNPQFTGLDALVLYCMVRHFRPSQIIEVGSGFSSRVSALAATRNPHTRLTCIDPEDEPRHQALRTGFPGLTSFVNKRAQDLPLRFYGQLASGDVLFIDTSHVAVIGGEVNYLFLEVLPRLAPGAIVHLHDVFIPFEYPRHWVMKLNRFFNEQYLCHAFLLHNREFEILFANAFMSRRHQAELKQVFPRCPRFRGSSFWIRRREPGA